MTPRLRWYTAGTVNAAMSTVRASPQALQQLDTSEKAHRASNERIVVHGSSADR